MQEPTSDSRNRSAQGTRPKTGPTLGPTTMLQTVLTHQREEVGVTVLEAGAVGGGVGVPVGGRGVAHGEGCLLGAVGGAVRAAVGRLRDLSMLL